MGRTPPSGTSAVWVKTVFAKTRVFKVMKGKRKMKVSILTTAYNHAPYIARALDSFLEQKTSFAFEIIVHDDASEDGTAEIIRQYAERYPTMIKTIFQEKNQYSQGADIYSFMKPLITGEYIAQCEGDDFWCDPQKLQKQVDYMDAHPECSYCFCNSYNVDLNSRIIGEQTPVDVSRVFSSREIIAAPEIFLATAGTLYRTRDAAEFPKEFLAGEAGDIPLRQFLMLRGNAYGFAERMCCYRMMTPGSCSDRYRREMKKNSPKFLKINEDYIRFYKAFDDYTQGRYHEELASKLNLRLYQVYRMKSDWKALHTPPFDTMFRSCPAKQKAIVFVKYYFPCLVKAYRLARYGKKGMEKEY